MSRTLDYLESVVYGKRTDFTARFVRMILLALSYVYQFSLALYLLPFKLGIRRRQEVEKPVISVGNITVGGTGKSPTAQYIVRGLAEKGWKPGILSYGYGGRLKGGHGIVSDGEDILLTPREAGDEPVMLAKSNPSIPVVVSKDRKISARTAIDELRCDVLVLDDGFQVWKFRRDIDVVLINAENPFDNRRTLPAGKLREPIKALKRADCVIVTYVSQDAVEKKALDEIMKAAPAVPVYFGKFIPSTVKIFDKDLNAAFLENKRVFAVSSIANPTAFAHTLEKLGAKIMGTEPFPDHHPYSSQDIARINRAAEEKSSEIIVITEKDAVKLDISQFALPTAILCIKLELDDEAGFWDLVQRKIS